MKKGDKSPKKLVKNDFFCKKNTIWLDRFIQISIYLCSERMFISLRFVE